MKPEDLTIPMLEQAVGRKAKFWPGNCYGIASKARELLGFGTLAYGHYLGLVKPKGFWKAFAGLPFVQHGWVILPGKLVLDPTRWSFLAEKPSIWIGPDDEYDRGGQVWRSTRPYPPPADDAAKNKIVLEISAEGAAHINAMLLREQNHGEINYAQAVWLCSGPVDALGQFAHQFFELLIENNWRAAIPIDTRRMVMGEDG